MILKEVLDKTTRFFKDKNFETARLDSELLISKALGLSRVELYMKYEQPLQDKEVELCREYVRRRGQGEPVAYILGQKDFYKLSFKVDSRVLIPRPETELLVEMALKIMSQNEQAKFDVLDLGCGSGCIGLSVAKHEPRAHVTMVDVSSEAVEVARANQTSLGLSEQTTILNADASEFDSNGQAFDIILANPPYIAKDDPEVQAEVKKFEPALALFSDDNGLKDVFCWGSKWAPCLKPNGTIIFEIGHEQAAEVKAFFESLRLFKKIEIVKDFSGHSRFIVGTAEGVGRG